MRKETKSTQNSRAKCSRKTETTKYEKVKEKESEMRV